MKPTREKLRHLLRHPSHFLTCLVTRIPYFRFIRETAATQVPITFSMWLVQKVLGINRQAYWPVHFTSRVYQPQNVYAGVETSPGYMPGCYIQAEEKIYIGDYSQIGPSVGIISANHDVYDCRAHQLGKPVRIGRYCWVGMHAVVLPGVELGDFTVVGAGAVVTKSFPEGYCVIAGNPARLIRSLDKAKCVEYKSQFEYNGYISNNQFEAYRQRHLNV
jgi:acetyltransferase-like isoleucine patch superfamily enzyme